MKSKAIKTVVILSMTALAGCAGLQNASTPLDYKTGVYVPQETVSSFVPGKTTQDDVVKAIGYPNQKTNVSGKEVWTYTYTQINAIPFVGTNKFENTVVEWTIKGQLVDAYKSSGTPGQTGNPLLNAAGM